MHLHGHNKFSYLHAHDKVEKFSSVQKQHDIKCCRFCRIDLFKHLKELQYTLNIYQRQGKKSIVNDNPTCFISVPASASSKFVKYKTRADMETTFSKRWEKKTHIVVMDHYETHTELNDTW